MTNTDIQPFDQHGEDTQFAAHQTRQESTHSHAAQSDSNSVTSTIAAAATGGITGATIGHILGGRVGATIGAVVGGVAGVAVVNESEDAAQAVGGIVDVVKNAPKRAESFASDVSHSFDRAIEDFPEHANFSDSDVDHTPSQITEKTKPSSSKQWFTLPAKTHHRLGVVLGRQGRLEEAIKEFQQALNLAPDSASAHYNLGIAFGKQGNLGQSLEHMQQARELCLEQGRNPQAEVVEQVIRVIDAG